MTREEAIADFKEEVYKFREYLEAKKINPLKPSDDEEYKEYIHFCHEIEKDIERDEIAISALSESKTQMIDKSNFDTEQYKADLQSAYDCGYNKALSENKGEWIVVTDSYHEDGTMYESHWECSKCGGSRSGWGEFKFCPDCGADMRGE